METTDRNALILYRIEQAKTSASDALFLIENNRLNVAVNRMYYALFYITSALAIKQQFYTSKHQQLIGWFNEPSLRKV